MRPRFAQVRTRSAMAAPAAFTASRVAPRHKLTRATRAVVAFAVAAGAAVVAVVLPASTAQAAPQPKIVTGWLPWYAASTSTQSVTANYDLFNEASPFWFEAGGVGTINIKSGATAAGLRTMTSALRAKGIKVVPSVTDAMSAGATAAMLKDPAARAQHVAALMNLVTTYELDGLDLDYETMSFSADAASAQLVRTGFPALLGELGAQLRARGKMLTVAVIAKTVEGTSPASQSQNYAAIGAVVDRMRIMTYDQNYSGTAYPGGPVSSVKWTDAVLTFATSQVPAAKIQMGVPIYGYDWKQGGGKASTVTMSQAQALMTKYNAARQWSVDNGAPTFTYTDETGAKHVVWYNDAQALQARLPLVGKHGLAGVAIWSLGTEDPGIWGVLRNQAYGTTPFGSFDGSSPAPGGARVSGWAIDANTSDPIGVHVYVDGVFSGAFTANATRRDVAATYGLFGDNHGFDAFVKVGAGAHQVCVYGINVGPGASNTQLGCRTVVGMSGNPYGDVNTATASPGGFQVAGWAIDPDVVDPIRMHVYVDGKFAGVTTADGIRNDVGAVYPAYGSKHGYSVKLTASGGKHDVCVYAINVGPGTSNPSVGCRSVTVASGNPFGSLDSVTVAGDQVVANGWSIDPDTGEPISVHIYVDGTWAAASTANAVRADVAKVYPAYGPNHGYSIALAKLAPGAHKVCAYAINVGAGTTNPQLACRNITVTG